LFASLIKKAKIGLFSVKNNKGLKVKNLQPCELYSVIRNIITDGNYSASNLITAAHPLLGLILITLRGNNVGPVTLKRRIFIIYRPVVERRRDIPLSRRKIRP
jgi:hypothetical protein